MDDVRERGTKVRDRAFGNSEWMLMAVACVTPR